MCLNILQVELSTVGAADHGYSEALYLEKIREMAHPEPIEINLLLTGYSGDGRIIGVTEELCSEIYDVGLRWSHSR